MAMLLNGSFKEIWITLGSYFSACLLVPILVGYIYPKRISDNLFVCSALCSAGVMTVWKLWPLSGVWAQIDGFYIGVSTSILILVFSKTKATKHVKSTTDL